jgi:hypothetical protein
LGRSGLTAEVQRLIEDCFETSTDVDVLLLAHSTRDHDWDGGGIAAALRIHPEQAERILARMAVTGLLRTAVGGYRYAPSNTRLDAAVRALAALHPSYRPAIVTLIFSTGQDRPRRA